MLIGRKCTIGDLVPWGHSCPVALDRATRLQARHFHLHDYTFTELRSRSHRPVGGVRARCVATCLIYLMRLGLRAVRPATRPTPDSRRQRSSKKPYRTLSTLELLTRLCVHTSHKLSPAIPPRIIECKRTSAHTLERYCFYSYHPPDAGDPGDLFGTFSLKLTRGRRWHIHSYQSKCTHAYRTTLPS